jgi:hypothetical protein
MEIQMTLLKVRVHVTAAFLLFGGLAIAQSQPNQDPGNQRQANQNQSNPSQANPSQANRPSGLLGQLNPQMLGEVLRSATTFHQLVENMNLSNSLGPDQHVVGPDGQAHHSLERTAATIGAGAGAGAAIGGMSKSSNGVLIGALIGSAGGLIVDQIVRRQEIARAQAFDPGAPGAPNSNNPQGNGWHTASPASQPPAYQYQYDQHQLKERDSNSRQQ